MSARFTSPFDELLERNRRELDALYRDAAPAAPSRSAPRPGTAGGAAGTDGAERPATADAPAPAAGAAAPAFPPSPPSPSPSLDPSSLSRAPSTTSAERLLDERYGDGWRFEITSQRRAGDEAIVVGTLRLPGSGGVRTQFGAAPIAAPGGSASGSVGGVGFSFGVGGGGVREDPRAAEEAAFERARHDALANCAALLEASREGASPISTDG